MQFNIIFYKKYTEMCRMMMSKGINIFKENDMAAGRKSLAQLSVPICLETLFYMLSGMVDTLMLSSVSDQAVGAVGTANTYIGVFIIMFGVISSGMVAVMSQNIGAGRPGIAYQARQLGLMFNALIGVLMSVILAFSPAEYLEW